MNLFLTSIFFFLIPNLYLFPGIENPYLTTQAIARLILIFLFFLNIYQTPKIHNIFSKNKLTLIFILILFFIQSISIISAINISAFIERYKDVVISLMTFFLFFRYKKNVNKIINILIIGFFVNLIFQADLFIFHEKGFLVKSGFIYKRYLDLALARIVYDGKLYTTTYDEIFIPFFFVFIKQMGKKRIIGYLGIIFTLFFSFASNFITKFLMAIFSLIASFFVLKKNKLNKNILILLFVIIITVFIGERLSFSRFGYSFINRFTTEEIFNENSSFFSRIEQYKRSTDMAQNFFGVGLGNYYDNLTNWEKYRSTSFYNRIFGKEVNQGVHNIFFLFLSETGYPGVLILIIIIFLFIKNDYLIISQKKEKDKIPWIISFWTLFIYGLFNPPVPGSYQILFWGIRGLLF